MANLSRQLFPSAGNKRQLIVMTIGDGCQPNRYQPLTPVASVRARQKYLWLPDWSYRLIAADAVLSLRSPANHPLFTGSQGWYGDIAHVNTLPQTPTNAAFFDASL